MQAWKETNKAKCLNTTLHKFQGMKIHIIYFSDGWLEIQDLKIYNKDVMSFHNY